MVGCLVPYQGRGVVWLYHDSEDQVQGLLREIGVYQGLQRLFATYAWEGAL